MSETTLTIDQMLLLFEDVIESALACGRETVNKSSDFTAFTRAQQKTIRLQNEFCDALKAKYGVDPSYVHSVSQAKWDARG